MQEEKEEEKEEEAIVVPAGELLRICLIKS